MIPRYVALHPSNDDDMDDSNFENVELEVIDDQEDFLETSAPLQLLTTASNNENSRYRSTYNNNSGDDSDDDSSEWDIQSSVENLAINNNRDSLRDFITRRAHTSRNTSDPEYQGMVELQDYLESSRKAGDSKWFFQEQYYKHYSGTDIISGPVLIKDEFQATIPTADFPPGLYYVTLCISLRGIDLNDIESMSVHCNSPTKESKTTIYSNELYYLPIYGTARLRLHQQVDISNLEPLSISIYFQCKSGEEVELYYVELQKRDPSPGIDYLITGFVRPQRSIDVWHTDNPGLPDEPKHPCWIEQYAVSSDGAYIATLSYTSIHAHIDVWNILTSEISFPSGYLHDNVPTAQKSTPWNGERILGLSISCDASQIAVYTINDTNKKVFAFHLLKHISPETFMPAEPTQDLMLANEAIRDCPELKKFIGYGKFLVSKVDDSTQFIACDALSVTLYNTDGKWTKVFSSSLSLENNLHHASILVNSATADQFLWTGNEDVMSIWDMSTGNPKTFVPLQSRWNAWSACFSADGSMVVLSYLEGIKIYEAKSGIELGIFRCHMSSCARRAVFIHDDTQILVDTGPQHDSPFQGYNCFTLDVRTLSQKELKYMPDSQDVMVHVTSGNSPRNEFLIHGHGSILDITHLHHHTLQSPDLNGVKCHQGCYSSRTYLSVDNREFSLYTGFEFQISMKDTIRKDGFIDKGLTTVVVAVNSWRDGYKEILSINPFEIYGMSKKDAKFIQAFVLAPRPHFAVISNLFVQIWSLPTEANPNCELLLVWKFSNTSRESFDGAIYSCAHGDQLFLSFIARHPGKRMERETYHCTLANVFGINSSTLFLEGIAYLPLMYSEAGEQARQAIIRYTSLHINSYPSPENIGNSVMTTLCKSWDDNTQNQCKAFMQDLLLTGQPRWTPRIDYTSESNPLSMLLGKAKKHPRVMGLARIIITYCINQAKQQQNPGYMAPVFGCLDELVKYSPKLALEFFQSMAYFPAAHRCVLINNYLIAHRPTIRPFWKKNNRPIHKCNDPVFQLHFKPENTDPLNDNFTKDIYVAPFDLLWKYDNLEHSWGDNPSTQKKWLYKFVRYIALLAMGLNYVQVHDCTLDFYDNPAIEALIEYKWNRFGFAFWLVRFIFQCIYYCLVLAVALLQIYHDDREVLHYLFIAIITFSAIFLWFEFLQLRRHWRRYTTSPYNVLDLLVFIVPMVASIILRNDIQYSRTYGSSRNISFSVVLIFLHFFFELRINKSICKFVSVMLHVIAEIKVFFTIFAVGIIYFTLAILHMYYGCSTEGGCGLGTDFPKHFFYALSNVYFVMGGRYDPLINALQKEDLAAHIMIMIYFFFTVVLMINFLIVLINTAFGKGDERWRQVWVENRLRYVEAAENMSFVIEGFRCKHNWFPNEIYYTAVPAQIEQYRNKLLKKAYTNHGGSSSFANTNANDPISNSTLLSEVLKQNQFLHGFINQVRPFLYQPMAFPYYQPQPAQFPYPTQSQELDPLEDPIPKPTSGYAIYDPLGDSNVQGGPNEASGRRSPSIGTVGLHGPSYLPQTPRPTFQQAQYTTESEYLYDNVGMSPYHSLTPYNPTPYQPQPYPSTPYQSASYQPASYYPTSFQPTTFQPQSPLPTPPQPTTALPTPLYPISSLPTPILGSLQHNAALPQRPRPQSIVALQNQSPYQTPGQTAIPAVSSQTPYQRHQTLFQSIPTPHQSQQMPSPSSQIPSYARHQTLFQDIPTPVLQNILGQPTYGYPPPDYSASAYGGQIPYSPYSRIPSSAQSAQSAPTSYQPTSSQSAPSHYHPASAQSAPSQHYSASAQNAQTPYLGYQVAHQSPQVPQAVRRPQAFVQTPQQSPTSPALATPISQSDILNELSNREVGRSSLRNVHVLTRVDTDESESVEETERSGENNEDEEQDNKDSQGENGNEAIRSDTAVIDERLDEFGLPIPASGRE